MWAISAYQSASEDYIFLFIKLIFMFFHTFLILKLPIFLTFLPIDDTRCCCITKLQNVR